MVLVVGGREQGKTAAALSLLENIAAAEDRTAPPVSESIAAAEGRTAPPVQESVAVMDGRRDPLEGAFSAALILHFEAVVRRLLEDGGDPEAFAGRLTRENPSAVVTADEIGCGVVPMDRFEREYREAAGRACQRLASFSGEVYRVVCGIPCRIK